MSNTKLIHTRLHANIKSSFKDQNGNYYVMLSSGIVLPLESENTINCLLRDLTDVKVSRKKNTIKEFLSDYIKPIIEEKKNTEFPT